MAIDPTASERIDQYIADAAGFAQPILKKIRAAIHKADREIVEVWKWGAGFERNGLVCGLAAFKAHVSLHFYKGALLEDKRKLLEDCSGSNAHARRLKFKTPADFDARVVEEYVREAATLNLKGIKAPARRAELPLPPDLKKAIAANAGAKAFWDGLAPGYRRDYIDWVIQAKQDATRDSRIETTVQWLSEGKTRNWKYMKP